MYKKIEGQTYPIEDDKEKERQEILEVIRNRDVLEPEVSRKFYSIL